MPPVTNLFLAALSAKSRDRLTSQCTAVAMPVRAILYESDERPEYAYFVTSGIASVITPMVDGSSAEVEIIGHEGVAGSLHLLGTAPVSTRCFMQMEGTALRMPLAELNKAFLTSSEIRFRLLEFVQEQVLLISQIAGCNRLHDSEARLARWLLMVQDRTNFDTLNFTHEFLAEMLGAQRTTVTMIAGALQRSGFISYRHGQVKVLDRENLEQAACDCYQVAKQLYGGLYKKPVA